MSQCGSGSDGFLTLGCLTSGFSPADSLKFKWTDPNGKDLTDFIQYPAIGNNGAYTSVSHVRVKPADWSTENAFTCTAEHPEGNKTEKPKIKKKITSKEEDNKKVTVNKEGTVNKEAQDLNINIYEPSNANGPQAVSLVCEINGSGDLGDVHVTWTKDKKTYIDGKITSPILKEDKSTSVFSILTVTAQDFNNPSVVFTCAVKHAGMKNESMPLMASTSKKDKQTEHSVKIENLCIEEQPLDEDEFSSLWSTALSFIFLFIFSLIYSAILSLSKMKS